MKLTLNRNTFSVLRKLGIQGISIIEFNDDLGPVPKFVHSQHARLIRRLLQDQIFSSKISILAKYASEARFADNSRIVIETFRQETDRIKFHYIVAQISERADAVRVRSFLRNISKRLCILSSFRKEDIEKILREAI